MTEWLGFVLSHPIAPTTRDKGGAPESFICLGLLSVDGLLRRIQTQCPSTPTYPVYVRTGGAPHTPQRL